MRQYSRLPFLYLKRGSAYEADPQLITHTACMLVAADDDVVTVRDPWQENRNTGTASTRSMVLYSWV